MCRSELARLDVSKIKRHEDWWVIADLVGKCNRVCTVPIPASVKSAIAEWTSAAGISSGLLRRLSRGGRILCDLSDWAVWHVVVNSASAIGIEHVAPHDLRRKLARLCQRHGGSLTDLKRFLGRASVLTTDRYLGNEKLGLRSITTRGKQSQAKARKQPKCAAERFHYESSWNQANRNAEVPAHNLKPGRRSWLRRGHGITTFC
jgi:integrase